jgi:hypothetical protein
LATAARGGVIPRAPRKSLKAITAGGMWDHEVVQASTDPCVDPP